MMSTPKRFRMTIDLKMKYLGLGWSSLTDLRICRKSSRHLAFALGRAAFVLLPSPLAQVRQLLT
jgi:hypothetical protein